jgi:hypothetical protein
MMKRLASTQYAVWMAPLLFTVLTALTNKGIAQSSPSSADDPSFVEVRTIFVAKCMACHGNDAKELKGEYDLRTRAAAIKGGESGKESALPGGELAG